MDLNNLTYNVNLTLKVNLKVDNEQMLMDEDKFFEAAYELSGEISSHLDSLKNIKNYDIKTDNVKLVIEK